MGLGTIQHVIAEVTTIHIDTRLEIFWLGDCLWSRTEQHQAKRLYWDYKRTNEWSINQTYIIPPIVRHYNETMAIIKSQRMREELWFFMTFMVGLEWDHLLFSIRARREMTIWKIFLHINFYHRIDFSWGWRNFCRNRRRRKVFPLIFLNMTILVSLLG